MRPGASLAGMVSSLHTADAALCVPHCSPDLEAMCLALMLKAKALTHRSM